MKKAFSLILALCMVLSLLTVGVFAAPETRDGLADGYYLIGSHNGWSADNLTEADRFHPSLGDPAEFVLETTLTQGQMFKVVRVENGAIATWYPEGSNNDYAVDAEHAGRAIIYFRNTYHNDWASNGGYVWVGGMPAISYVDETGSPAVCETYHTANFAGPVWTGNIVLNENTTFNERIFVNGSATLILEDGCTLDAKYGIEVAASDSLTIYGQSGQTGILNAGDAETLEENMERNIAGIGGNNHINAGTITINGGNVNARGADGAAGIGGGFFAGSVCITINAGNVNAWGGDSGDGIGDGESANDSSVITINGGTVNAYGGPSASGIGNKYNLASQGFIYGIVTINGGTVYAIGGDDTGANGEFGGAGIGADHIGAEIGTIIINGGEVTAIGQCGGAGIGATSDMCLIDRIEINGGVVNATGSGSAPAIGTAGGYNFNNEESPVGSIVISGGQVTAVAGEDAAFAIGGVTPDWYWEDPVYSAVTLSWDTPEDFIQTDAGFSNDVTLEKDFVNAADPTEVFAAGTVADVSVLSGKKLIPPVNDEPSTDLDLVINNTLALEGATTLNYFVSKDALDAYGLDSFKLVVVHTAYADGEYVDETVELEAKDELYAAVTTGSSTRTSRPRN
ncbi:MAG: hypothetical protein IJL93_02980 [Bacteroidales bacterium]|nr:hypothetical protein [Bacteroidales bacterium]